MQMMEAYVECDCHLFNGFLQKCYDTTFSSYCYACIAEPYSERFGAKTFRPQGFGFRLWHAKMGSCHLALSVFTPGVWGLGCSKHAHQEKTAVQSGWGLVAFVKCVHGVDGV